MGGGRPVWEGEGGGRGGGAWGARSPYARGAGAHVSLLGARRAFCRQQPDWPPQQPRLETDNCRAPPLRPRSPSPARPLLPPGPPARPQECSICLGTFTAPCITPCGHVFCKSCILASIARDKPACPLCRCVRTPTGVARRLSPLPATRPGNECCAWQPSTNLLTPDRRACAAPLASARLSAAAPASCACPAYLHTRAPSRLARLPGPTSMRAN
jgi:hypothetical protein